MSLPIGNKRNVSTQAVGPRMERGPTQASRPSVPTDLEQSRTSGIQDARVSTLASLVIGAFALSLVVVGTSLALIIGGVWSYQAVAETLTSRRLEIVCLSGAALGCAAFVIGTIFYRRVDTKSARNMGVAGLVLGILAMLLGLGVYVFTRGDMETFAENFMNFSDVRSSFGAFVGGIKNTLILAGSAFGLSLAIGLPVSCLLISRHIVVRAPARVYVNVVRGTPVLLQLSIVYFGLSLGLGLNLSAYVALIIGLSINGGAYAAEVFRAGLQSIEKGQLEASRGLGLNYTQSLLYVVIPQAVRRVIPPLLNEFIGLIKDTSLIAFLGVTLSERDIYAVASNGYTQFYNASFFVAAGLGYLVVTLPLIAGVNALERRMRTGLVGIA